MIEVSNKEVAKLLKNAQCVMITAHKNPDGDALGSCLGLKRALQNLGKKADVYIDDHIVSNYQILPGIEAIKQAYPTECFYDLCVVLDCEVERTGGSAAFVAQNHLPVLNIDHHESNPKNADYLLLEPHSAATGEIVYNVIKEMGNLFDYEVATAVYTAIATDCGFFRYANTKPSTMLAAAEMLNYGVQPHKLSERLEERSYEELKAQAKIIESIRLEGDGKIALAMADKAMVESCETTEGFVDIARFLRGVDVSVFLKYVSENMTRVSMRSKDTNVAAVAESLGGGGHQRAAGCTLQEDLPAAAEVIVAALKAAMELDKNAD